MKFDLCGVACSNDGRTDVNVLVEGFWPGEKTENTVLSILHHSISLRSGDTWNVTTGDRLVLHADSFTGQNKNRLVLFYIVWRVTVVYEDEVVLHFLDPGYTKNVGDGSFGHVKRCFRQTYLVIPA